jgi:hypothetical protein
MGLDVYVGPLSRYYSGDWETILQQMARQGGLPITVIRAGEPKVGLLRRLVDRVLPRKAPDPASVIAAWKQTLPAALPACDWSDVPDGPYFTDKPAWDCYGALVLWAAYDEHPPKERLSAATDKWNHDETYLRVAESPASRYRHLVGNTEVWLPIDFETPFSAPMPNGVSAIIGSCPRLLFELNELNARTWKASAGDIELWRKEGAEFGAPLEVSARFGFSIFHGLSSKAVERRLPMKLDY